MEEDEEEAATATCLSQQLLILSVTLVKQRGRVMSELPALLPFGKPDLYRAVLVL